MARPMPDEDLDAGADPNEPVPSSVGEDGEDAAEPNSFPRSNMLGTEHYDHGIDSADSTPFEHGGGGVSSYGKEHPQHPGHPRHRHGGRMHHHSGED